VNVVLPLLVIGLVAGSIYGLAGLGLVLTYRTTGVFDIAYGAMAMVNAYVFWQLAGVWELPTWLALIIVVGVVAVILGLLREWLYRRLSGVTVELQLVVSAALLTFFTGLALIVYGPTTLRIPSVFPTTSFHIAGNLYLGVDQVLTLAVSAALALLLFVVLRFSRLGLTAQAVVDNRDLAELSGVSGVGVARIVWVVTTAFAALAGVLLAAQQGLDTTALIGVVSYSFFGAVVGRLTNLPLAYAGGLAIGVVQGILVEWSSSGVLAQLQGAIPYLGLLLALIIYGHRIRAVEASSRQVQIDFTTNMRRQQRVILLLIVAGVAVVLPWLLSHGPLAAMTVGFSYAIIAIGVVMLTGWAGEVSLAQLTFAGIGAFTVAHLAGQTGSFYIPALFVAVLLASAVSVLIGIMALRLRGIFLALATLALAYVFDTLIFTQIPLTGGTSGGIFVPPLGLGPLTVRSPVAEYYVVLAVLVGALLFARRVRTTGLGRRLRAMRDGPVALSTLGANILLTKVTVFAMAAALAAIGGALYGTANQSVGGGDFAFPASLTVLLFVVFFGRSMLTAAVVSGVFFAMSLLPLFSPIQAYLPLGISMGVTGLSQSPEGHIWIYSRTFGQLRRLVPGWRTRVRDTNRSDRDPVNSQEPVTVDRAEAQGSRGR
jgi:ABC-type branched-subunit amino acid transport system permease subunit